MLSEKEAKELGWNDSECSLEDFNEAHIAMSKLHKEAKVNEVKKYLSDTDYKMTIDYFATLTKEAQDELIRRRAEVRQFIRENEVL